MDFVRTFGIFALFTISIASDPYSQWRNDDNPCGISDYVPGHRILNGKDVPPKKYPWLVAIEYDGIPLCTGSIISNRFILTAAHCAFDRDGLTLLPPEKVIAFVGSVDKLKAQQIRLRAFTAHPDYLKSTDTNCEGDIAIAELEREIKFDSNARPICLGKTFEEHNGIPAVIAGWGDTIWTEVSPSQVLKEGTAEFVEFEPCKEAFLKPLPGEPGRRLVPTKEQQICALGTNNTDIWSGDSGGPLVSKSQKDIGSKVRWVQHGVTSFTTFIHHREVPAAFTRITTFCDWIRETTKGEAECVDY